MIGKLTTALTLTSAALLFGAGAATADTGAPGTALTGVASCEHDDDHIEIEMDAPTVYAQAGYLPGEHQHVRYRTIVIDLAQGTLAGASAWHSGRATATDAADLDDTEVELLRAGANAYQAVQQIEWLAPDGEHVVATAELAATAYEIEDDDDTHLGTFDSCL